MDTAGELDMFFPGVTAQDTPDGAGFAASEWVRLTTHSGTHLDAPYHFHPTMNGRDGTPERSITIDEVPLEWCFQPGVKLDFRHLSDGYVVSASDVEEELARIGHVLQPLDIVLVNTAAGKALGEPDYVNRGCGMGYEAKLHNLEALPGHGFTVSCFPHKIKGASAGWTRAVAIFED